MDELKIAQYAKCFIAIGQGTTSTYFIDDINACKQVIDLLKRGNLQTSTMHVSEILKRTKIEHNEVDAKKIAIKIKEDLGIN